LIASVKSLQSRPGRSLDVMVGDLYFRIVLQSCDAGVGPTILAFLLQFYFKAIQNHSSNPNLKRTL
jgi:hypothetical protein